MKAKVVITEKFGYIDEVEEKIVEEYNHPEVVISVGTFKLKEFTGTDIDSCIRSSVDFLKDIDIFDYTVIHLKEIRTWNSIVIAESGNRDGLLR